MKSSPCNAILALLALLLAACGGGNIDKQGSTCSLVNAAGCGGSLPSSAPATPTVPPREPGAVAAPVSGSNAR